MASRSISRRSGFPTFSEPSYARLAIQLGETVQAHAEAALAPVELTPREYDAMLCIAACPDLSQHELSERLGLYAPRMVSLIDALEARHLLKRAVSSKDRRKNVVRLTDKGTTLLESSKQLVAEFQQDLFGVITDREFKRFQKFVEGLAAKPCPHESQQADPD